MYDRESDGTRNWENEFHIDPTYMLDLREIFRKFRFIVCTHGLNILNYKKCLCKQIQIKSVYFNINSVMAGRRLRALMLKFGT
jgi:hypothetical protein